MKDKDFIIKNRAGLYLMKRKDGTDGMTNLKHATHFHSKNEVKSICKQYRSKGYVVPPLIIDLKQKKAS